jgi:hypothetical protein
MTVSKIAKQKAIEDLKKILKEGDLVYTVLRSVSRSGMSRQISVMVPVLSRDGKPVIQDITGYVQDALDYKANKKGAYALVVGGCGMDMGFHVVYQLASILFNDGYAIAQRWL